MVCLLGSVCHLVYKLHCHFEVRKAKHTLDCQSVPLPAWKRTKRLLNFRIGKHSHKTPFLKRCDSSWFGEKFQPCPELTNGSAQAEGKA
jgi:hypothetical protein